MKTKFGTVEFFGFLGLAIWALVVLLRPLHISDNSIFMFFLGILPNLGAPWGLTMFLKWFVQFFKKSYSYKIHFTICTFVFILVLTSEIIFDIFFGSSFDCADMAVTLLGQLTIFTVPIVKKDQSIF